MEAAVPPENPVQPPIAVFVLTIHATAAEGVPATPAATASDHTPAPNPIAKMAAATAAQSAAFKSSTAFHRAIGKGNGLSHNAPLLQVTG